jgi:DNA-binding GntR family transcriptional regulator
MPADKIDKYYFEYITFFEGYSIFFLDFIIANGKLETHYAQGDREKYISANNVFHALIQELAGNRILDEIVRRLRAKVPLYRHQQIYEPRRFDESMREHRGILEALRSRDPDAAERLMKSHLDRQCQALLHLI